jgi:hypothetical protein
MPDESIAEVLERMSATLASLEPDDHRRAFLATYARTTHAVGDAVDDARFEDPEWVARWDVAFADLYLDALAADATDPASPPRPWRIAFGAEPALHPLQHVLLGINAHVNFDLPQALLAVINDADFDHPLTMARRRRDHERIDAVLSSRVAAEDAQLEAATGGRTLTDRLLQPLNRAASRRFLRESRQKVWHNTILLQQARAIGEATYRARLADLEVLSSARVADLLAPGNALLRLAVAGFGVQLPPD